MQLVIEIPDELYDDYKTILKTEIDDYGALIDRAIYYGIPLPKHHGRLKDVDAFISKVKVDRKHSVYSRSWTADDVLTALDNSYVPTIVEADRGEEK